MGTERLLFEIQADTDLGLKRAKNEDSYRFDSGNGLFLVADGMGGHLGGEVASTLAVDTMVNFIQVASQDDSTWPFEIDESLPESANRLKVAVQLANGRIFQTALEHPEYEGMGTTIVATYLDGRKLHVAHVGDSRAYLIRSHRIVPLTSDHSWVNIQLSMGAINEDEARHHPMRNIITRALGTRREVEVDIKTITVRPGDRLVLCTDGLSNVLADSEILKMVEGHDCSRALTPAALISRANQQSGDDNVTVVIVWFDETDREDEEITQILSPDQIVLRPDGEQR